MKIVKRISVIFLTLILSMSIPFSVFAQSTITTNSKVEYFDDGSYLVTEFTETIAPFSSGSKSEGKTATYYSSDDERQWSVTIWGTFTYTGSSATCTNASTSYTVYNSAWKVKEATATKSGRTATGNFLVKKYWLGIITKTVPMTVIMSCDNSGNIS